MIIVAIRSDRPEAEISLFDSQTKLAYDSWHAHRELAETLHTRIHMLLQAQEKDWQDIQAIAAYQGPGSFTGLRIGLSVANALAYSLGIPIAGGGGDQWLEVALQKLVSGQASKQIMPDYGAPVHTTQPKK